MKKILLIGLFFILGCGTTPALKDYTRYKLEYVDGSKKKIIATNTTIAEDYQKLALFAKDVNCTYATMDIVRNTKIPYSYTAKGKRK